MFCCGKGNIKQQIVKEEAATCIQKYTRSFLAKNKAQQIKTEVLASTKINKLARGFIARKNIKQIAAQKGFAATLITKIVRGYFTRKITDKIKITSSIQNAKDNIFLQKLHLERVTSDIEVIINKIGNQSRNKENLWDFEKDLQTLAKLDKLKQNLIKLIPLLTKNLEDLEAKVSLKEDVVSQGRESEDSGSELVSDSDSDSISDQGGEILEDTPQATLNEEVKVVNTIVYPKSWIGEGGEAIISMEEYSQTQPKQAEAAKLHIFKLHSKVKVLGFLTLIKQVLENQTSFSKTVVERCTNLKGCYSGKIGKYQSIFLLQLQKLIQRETGDYKLKAGEKEVYDQVDTTKGFVDQEVRDEILSKLGDGTIQNLYSYLAKMEFSKEMSKVEKAAISQNMEKELEKIPNVNLTRAKNEIKAGTDPRAIVGSLLMEVIIKN
jgi:hypothetical protein